MIVPEIAPVMAFKEALLAAGKADLALIPYEDSEHLPGAGGMALTRELIGGLKPGQSMAVLIGPEGGFSDEEIRPGPGGRDPAGYAGKTDPSDGNGGVICPLGGRTFTGSVKGMGGRKEKRSWKKERQEMGSSRKEIYFDNSATTRVFDSVRDIMTETMTADYGNTLFPPYKGRGGGAVRPGGQSGDREIAAGEGKGDHLHLRRHGIQ